MSTEKGDRPSIEDEWSNVAGRLGVACSQLSEGDRLTRCASLEQSLDLSHEIVAAARNRGVAER